MITIGGEKRAHRTHTIRRTALELAHRLGTPAFFATVALGALVFFAGVNIEVSSEDVMYMYRMAMAYGIFVIVAPCLAVLPSIRYLRNKRDNLLSYNLIRSGRNRYLLGQAACASLTGGLALALGPALTLGCLLARYPMTGDFFRGIYPTVPELNASFTTLIVNEWYLAFLLANLMLIFWYGMSVNMIAYAVSWFASDSFVIAFVPFILLQLTTLWPLAKQSALANATFYLHGHVYNLPFDNTWGFLAFVLAVHAGIWIVCFIISARMLKRRMNHA